MKLVFNNEQSQKLDDLIITTLSNMLESQNSVRQKVDKHGFLVKERKVLYDLFMQVNEERRVSFSFNCVAAKRRVFCIATEINTSRR